LVIATSSFFLKLTHMILMVVPSVLGMAMVFLYPEDAQLASPSVCYLSLSTRE
jgi:hypothetical protein